jgi:hypothetical protein
MGIVAGILNSKLSVMKKCILVILVVLSIWSTEAQVAINTNGNTAGASSILDVSSTSKGLLMPRMNSAQRKAIVNPELGLLVFDTDRQTIYFFNGQKWKPMMAASESTAPLVSRDVVGARIASGFGHSADMFGNFAVVGAPIDTVQGVTSGAAYIFEFNNGVWSQAAKIHPPFPMAFEGFGKAVSISNDYIVVGAPDKTVVGADKRGAIYVFKRFNRTWSYMGVINASNGLAYDQFGSTVAVSDGYIAAGAPYRHFNNIEDAGSVYVFGLVNNNWEQKANLYASDPVANAHFGFSLDIQQTRLAIGAPAALEGSGNSINNGGAVYIFNKQDANGFIWSFAQKINTGYSHTDMKFGASVSIENNLMAIGAPDYSGVGGNGATLGLGAIFRYAFVNGNWAYQNIMTEYNDYHKLGTSVAISNGVYMAGMPGYMNGRGKALILESQHRYVYDEDPHHDNKFGTVIAGHSGHFLVTAPFNAPYGQVFFGVVE